MFISIIAVVNQMPCITYSTLCDLLHVLVLCRSLLQQKPRISTPCHSLQCLLTIQLTVLTSILHLHQHPHLQPHLPLLFSTPIPQAHPHWQPLCSTAPTLCYSREQKLVVCPQPQKPWNTVYHPQSTFHRQVTLESI